MAIAGLPLFVVPGLTDSSYAQSVFALMVIVLLVLTALGAIWWQGSMSLRVPWPIAAAAGLLIAAALSLTRASFPQVALQSIALLSAFLMLALLLANIVRERKDLAILVSAWAVCAGIVALYGILQYFRIVPGHAVASRLDAVVSTIGNPNFVSSYLILSSFLIVAMLALCRGWILRTLLAMPLGLSVALVVLLRRGTLIPILAVAVGFSLLSIVRIAIWNRLGSHARKTVLVSGACLVLLVALLFSFAPQVTQPIADPLVSWFTQSWEANSGAVRELNWLVGAEMLGASPVAGVGMGHYKIDYLSAKASILSSTLGDGYQTVVNPAAQAHNEYVQFAAETGIVGILTLLVAIANLIIAVAKRARRLTETPTRIAHFALWLGFVSFLVLCLVSFPAHVASTALAFTLICGILLSPVFGDTAIVTIQVTKKIGVLCHVTLLAIAVVVIVLGIGDLRANWLMERGISLAAGGDLSLAESTLNRSATLDFAPRQVYYHLAVTQIRLGKLEDAQENLERCLTRFVDAAVLLNYANLLVNTGQAADAVDPLSLLLASNPGTDIQRRARYLVAFTRSEAGDVRGGIEQILAVLRDHPTFETPYIGLGTLYASIGELANAERAFSDGITLVDVLIREQQEILSTPPSLRTPQVAQEARARLAALQSNRAELVRRREALLDGRQEP